MSKPEVRRRYELGCNAYVTRPIHYDACANALADLGLFFSVVQIATATT